MADEPHTTRTNKIQHFTCAIIGCVGIKVANYEF